MLACAGLTYGQSSVYTGRANQVTIELGGQAADSVMAVPILPNSNGMSKFRKKGRIWVGTNDSAFYYSNGTTDVRLLGCNDSSLYVTPTALNTAVSGKASKEYVDSAAESVSGISYTRYDFLQGNDYNSVAQDGKWAMPLNDTFYTGDGWTEGLTPYTTSNVIQFTTDLVTWDTCIAPWRRGHTVGIGVIHGATDTLIRFWGDLNDTPVHDMSAWVAYRLPGGNGKLGFLKTKDSVAIPPRILFGSATTANGWTYAVGGQRSTANGDTLYGDIIRTADAWRTHEIVLTDDRLKGNKSGCVVARGNDLYILGGGIYYPDRVYTRAAYKLSEGEDTLRTLDSIPMDFGVQYPTTFLDTNTDKIIFAFGANAYNDGNQKQILSLGTDDKWYRIFSDEVPARHAAAGAIYKSKWVIIGGHMDGADTWQSNFIDSTNRSADDWHIGEVKYGTTSDYVLTAQPMSDGRAHLAIGLTQNFFARLGVNNTFTGENNFQDVGIKNLALYPATAIMGASQFSNYGYEPILVGFNTTGKTWKTTANDWGDILRITPPTGNGYGLRIQLEKAVPVSSDYLAAFSAGSGNGSFLHSWRGDGSHYAHTRFPYTSGGFQIGGYNIGSNREEYITSVPVSLGGTGLTSLGTAGQYLTVNAGATGLQYSTLSVTWASVTGKPTTTTGAGYTDISTTNTNNSVARRDASGYIAATHLITKDTTTYQVNVAGILVRKVAEEYVYTDGPQPVNRFLLPLTETSSTSVTLPTTNALYVLTGTSPTATLPAKSAGRQLRIIIKNGGSTDITLTTVAGTSILWYNSAVTSYTITAGKAVEIIEGATYYYIMAFN